MERNYSESYVIASDFDILFRSRSSKFLRMFRCQWFNVNVIIVVSRFVSPRGRLISRGISSRSACACVRRGIEKCSIILDYANISIEVQFTERTRDFANKSTGEVFAAPVARSKSHKTRIIVALVHTEAAPFKRRTSTLTHFLSELCLFSNDASDVVSPRSVAIIASSRRSAIPELRSHNCTPPWPYSWN